MNRVMTKSVTLQPKLIFDVLVPLILRGVKMTMMSEM